jgi:hypothetical protein
VKKTRRGREGEERSVRSSDSREEAMLCKGGKGGELPLLPLCTFFTGKVGMKRERTRLAMVCSDCARRDVGYSRLKSSSSDEFIHRDERQRKEDERNGTMSSFCFDSDLSCLPCVEKDDCVTVGVKVRRSTRM